MKKRCFLIPIILLVSIYILISWNKTFLLLWNANAIAVTTKSPLQTKKVKIKFGCPATSINRKTDKELFTNSYFTTTFFNGKKAENLPNEYGENDFLITYADSLYFAFRHYKLNRRDQHDYEFDFSLQKDTVFVKTNIKGTFKMKFKAKMHPIKDADKYYANREIKN